MHGPWAPGDGHRCNPAKLLIDPYARVIDGPVQWNEAVFSYRFDDPDGGPNPADSAPFVPRCVVAHPLFPWESDRRPGTPLHDTIIYETHVKGFTAWHPDIPPELRGTYASPTPPRSSTSNALASPRWS